MCDAMLRDEQVHLLDVLTDVRLGALPCRPLLAGVASLEVDALGRRVLVIHLSLLPADGRCYVSLQEVLTLAG